MPSSRAADERPLARRVLDAVATAWAIAEFAAIGFVAAALALVLVPTVFVVIWSLEALHFFKLID
jgi:hypothetical protein